MCRWCLNAYRSHSIEENRQVCLEACRHKIHHSFWREYKSGVHNNYYSGAYKDYFPS